VIPLVGASLREPVECLLVATDADESIATRSKPMLNVLKCHPSLIIVLDYIEHEIASDNVKLTLIEIITLEVERIILLETQSISIKSLATPIVKAIVARNTIKESLGLHPLHRSGQFLAGQSGQVCFVHGREYMHRG
jgi:hypothetical protein